MRFIDFRATGQIATVYEGLLSESHACANEDRAECEDEAEIYEEGELPHRVRTLRLRGELRETLNAKRRNGAVGYVCE